MYMNTVVSDDDSLTHNLLVHKTKNNKGGGVHLTIKDHNFLCGISHRIKVMAKHRAV